MTAKELRNWTLRLPDDAEVKVLIGPDEEPDSYKEASAELAIDFDTEERYLLVGEVW
jgi:hypothetical protein